VFPALSYSYLSENEKFQHGLLGLAWYRNQDPAEKSDSRYLLGGLLYGEKQVAERGYHSRGSLWNVLWQYETESETGFIKFSIMKFVYKRVHIDGVVSHRVLGVKVSESPAE
jgi:hypothetical protein